MTNNDLYRVAVAAQLGHPNVHLDLMPDAAVAASIIARLSELLRDKQALIETARDLRRDCGAERTGKDLALAQVRSLKDENEALRVRIERQAAVARRERDDLRAQLEDLRTGNGSAREVGRALYRAAFGWDPTGVDVPEWFDKIIARLRTLRAERKALLDEVSRLRAEVPANTLMIPFTDWLKREAELGAKIDQEKRARAKAEDINAKVRAALADKDAGAASTPQAATPDPHVTFSAQADQLCRSLGLR